MKKKLVSVIITAFNAQEYISQAILSIISQTYKNLEIIIVDDGSKDKTFEIARYYSMFDKRIKVFKLKKNKGPSLASNFALKKAKGVFIARMDADDIAIPERIEKQVNFLLSNPQVVVVGGQCLLINEKDEVFGEKKYPFSHKDIYESLFIFNPIQHPACMFRRDIIQKKKIIYHNHSYLAHDLELIFELAKYGELANLKDVILCYRLHKNSLSQKEPKKTFKATLRVREKAIKKYDYKPSIKGVLTHYCQIILVSILPQSLVTVLFNLIRIKKKIFIPNFRFLFRYPFSRIR